MSVPHNGVYNDDKAAGVYDEKSQIDPHHPSHVEEGHHDPRFPGKTNEYAVEVAPAGATGVHDAVFGDMEGEGPNYRAVGPIGAFVLMTKANIGLGVLSIPFVFQLVGMVPGVILLFVLNILVMYTACTIGDFKLNHPEMYAIADAGYVVGGRIGREYFGIAFVLFMIFVSGSGMVGISTALNAVSMHGACTAIFIFVAAAIGFMMAMIRTLGKIAWLGWVGLISIFAAILILTIAVGIQDRPVDAIKQGYVTGPWPKDLKITTKATFADAMTSINSILFAYAATPTYFGIISEMRDPRSYKKAVVSSMLLLWVTYTVIGVVVYYYCGQFVSSPALGSAGTVMKKVCYGIAIPALLVTLCIYSHLAAKYFFVRILHGTKHLAKPTKIHWITWLSCVFGAIFIAYIIASAIPIFGNLISLIGALIGPSVTLIPYSIMWWHDNWRYNTNRTGKQKLLFAFNIFIFLVGLFITGAGTYGAIDTIIKDPSRTKPWSCADNSKSVEA